MFLKALNLRGDEAFFLHGADSLGTNLEGDLFAIAIDDDLLRKARIRSAELGTSVRAVYEHTYLYNRVYGHPIYPIGQTYEAPGSAGIKLFRRFAASYGVAWLLKNRRELIPEGSASVDDTHTEMQVFWKSGLLNSRPAP